MPSSSGLSSTTRAGHGLYRSSAIGEAAPTSHVADVAGLIDRLEIERVVFCGLSVGGVIGQAFAATHSHALAALVLCCTAARVGTAEAWDERIRTVREKGLEALAGPVMERWFSTSFRAAEPEMIAGMTNMLVRQPAEGYAAICRMLRDTDLTAGAAGITVPTLGVACTEDGSTPPDLVKGTVERIPGASFALIEGGRPHSLRGAPAGACRDPARLPRREGPLVTEPLDSGMATRRRVLGEAHVARAEAAKTAFDAPFRRLVTEGAWRRVWSSGRITHRERSMVTLARLAALGHHEAFACPQDPGSGPLHGEGARRERIAIIGRVRDGMAAPVRDAAVEIWQADAAGLHPSPAGTCRRRASPSSSCRAGSISASARGWSFAEAAQADGADPVMSRIGHPARRQTLVARRAGHDYVFDIRPQGEGETVFPDG